MGTVYNQTNEVKSKCNSENVKLARILLNTGSSGCVISKKNTKEF